MNLSNYRSWDSSRHLPLRGVRNPINPWASKQSPASSGAFSALLLKSSSWSFPRLVPGTSSFLLHKQRSLLGAVFLFVFPLFFFNCASVLPFLILSVRHNYSQHNLSPCTRVCLPSLISPPISHWLPRPTTLCAVGVRAYHARSLVSLYYNTH